MALTSVLANTKNYSRRLKTSKDLFSVLKKHRESIKKSGKAHPDTDIRRASLPNQVRTLSLNTAA